MKAVVSNQRPVLRALPSSRPSAMRSGRRVQRGQDRKSTRLNSSHDQISYAVFCLKKKKKHKCPTTTEPLLTTTPPKSPTDTSRCEKSALAARKQTSKAGYPHDAESPNNLPNRTQR